MHDIRKIRENPDKFNSELNKRNISISAKDILVVDKTIRELLSHLQSLQEKRNSLSKNIGLMVRDNKDVSKIQLEVKKIKDTISELDIKLKEKEQEVDLFL